MCNAGRWVTGCAGTWVTLQAGILDPERGCHVPWKVDPVPELRLALVHSVRSAGLSVAEAARRFGVSRKTAHKWLARHDAEPERSLTDRSRRPARSPGRTPEDAERAV